MLAIPGCCFVSLQSAAGQAYGNLPVHMYAVHSTAASALTAHVAAAAAAANQQQHGRPGASSAQSPQGSSRQESRPAHKDDFVEVEKSNMVMLVSEWAGWQVQQH